jgi:hypothetical protein
MQPRAICCWPSTPRACAWSAKPHDFPAEAHQALIALRNSYEDKFKVLIDRLPVRRGVDKSLLRLQLIGALNHVPIWYRPGGRKSLPAIARAMTAHVRLALDEPRH